MWPFVKKKTQDKKELKPKRPTPPSGQLDLVTRQLYSRGESTDLTQRQQQLTEPVIRRTELDDESVSPLREQPVSLAKLAEERAKKRRSIWLYIFVGIGLFSLAGIAASGTLWYRWQRTVSAEDIGLTIKAPAAFTAGEEITYTVAYQNNSRVNWENVELTIETPLGFTLGNSSQEITPSGRSLFLAVGNLSAGSGDLVELKGQLLAARDAALAITAELTITPENFPSGRFSQTATVTTIITNTPLGIGLDLAKDAAAGELVKATITVTNAGASSLDSVFLALSPAAGMQLATEDPQYSLGFSTSESEWQLGSLEPLATVTREAVVLVLGAAGESRTLEVQTGVMVGKERYIQQTQTGVIKISASELIIDQTYNEASELATVRAGDHISGVINYANSGSTGLRDVVVRASFEGVGLDPTRLKLGTGSYDPVTKTIIWTAATVSELAVVQPGQVGKIPYEFSILASDAFPTEGEAITNHALIITAQIDSPDVVVPVGQESKVISSRFIISVATDMTLGVDSYYDDGRLGITSTGPTPPEVGQQTTYTVRVRLGSTLNDLGDIRVTAVLPDGVQYTGETYTTVGDLKYNDRTGELNWSIPFIAGLTGRASPLAEAQFQIAITPGENQRGEKIKFLNKLTGTATDLFTDTVAGVNLTNYPSTATAVPGKGEVQ